MARKQSKPICCDCGSSRIITLKTVSSAKGEKIKIVQVFKCKACGNQWEKEKSIRYPNE